MRQVSIDSCVERLRGHCAEAEHVLDSAGGECDDDAVRFVSYQSAAHRLGQVIWVEMGWLPLASDDDRVEVKRWLRNAAELRSQLEAAARLLKNA